MQGMAVWQAKLMLDETAHLVAFRLPLQLKAMAVCRVSVAANCSDSFITSFAEVKALLLQCLQPSSCGSAVFLL